MNKIYFPKWLSTGIVVMLAATACTLPQETLREEATSIRPTIKLAKNPWLSAELNTVVAQLLLEEELGYPVELIAIDDQAQYLALENGDVHASLEVWPLGYVAEIQQYVRDRGTVENGGCLGPIGKIGWYVPTYMLDEHPELATWEGFKDPENVALFRTPESGDKGQFLAGDPSWYQFDADIIRNLGLDLEVVTVGSEEAILAALDAAYSGREPILFYFWTPLAAFAQYELTQVELPEYSDACYANMDSGGIDCDYPTEMTTKLFWSGLGDYAPDAYYFLKSFYYTTEDLITMLALVDIQGKTVEQAARIWIEQNENVWRAWIP